MGGLSIGRGTSKLEQDRAKKNREQKTVSRKGGGVPKKGIRTEEKKKEKYGYRGKKSLGGKHPQDKGGRGD